MPSLNTGGLCSEVSDLLSLGLGLQAPLIVRSTGCSLPALQYRGSFGFTCLRNTDKRLKEEAPLPPRLSPRVPNPRIREEWGIQEVASLPATTRGQITNQGQGSSTSSGPPRPKPSVTTTPSTLAANTSGQGSGGDSGHSGHSNGSQRSKTGLWTKR